MRHTRIVRQITPSSTDLPVDLPAILRGVYARRGILRADELERELGRLASPERLSGIADAVEYLAGAVELGARILIVGDFDADGATSCALGVLALRSLGHSEVDYLVPNRFEFGYGLSPEIVDLAAQRRPDLIVTVDNGISSHSGVEAARRHGITVLVTDHHLPGAYLPAAAAIVNPNQAGDEFPSKAIAGVGVIFYVMLALRSRLRELAWFDRRGIKEPNMARLLDLVALGTVADVVALDANNRILVHHGLARIRAGECRPGIEALLQIAGRNPRQAQASDMGFAVGPRLNAAGRLEDMSLGIECLLTDDAEKAFALASRLDVLNRERRQIEDDMRAQAEVILADWAPASGDELPWGLCLFQEDWHQGVIGILAARIKERYQRPVIAFAAADDIYLKGSARSISGLHVRDALDELAAIHPEILEKFGGHAMAAGMTIRREHLERFSAAFDAIARRRLSVEDLRLTLHSDGGVAPSELTLDTAQLLLDGGPWGQGFPEPLFDDQFAVVSKRVVGMKHWKLVLRHQGGGPTLDAIAFNSVADMPELPLRLHAAYRLDINEWRGERSLQLRIEYLEALE